MEVQRDNPKVKPESSPDDSTIHALGAFAQSLAYSAVEAPTRGVAQIVDYSSGTKFDTALKTSFDGIGISQPQAAAFGTKTWYAEQLGGAIGMAAPMMLISKGVLGKTESAIANTAGAKFLGASASDMTLAQTALREAKFGAASGLIYGSILTPTEQNSGNFISDRFKQGIAGAATFGAMGFAAPMTGSLLNKVGGTVESNALNSVAKSSIVQGAISGIPGGAINAEIGAWQNGKSYASLQDLKESVVGMTFAGGALGAVGVFKHNNLLSLLRADTEAHKDITAFRETPADVSAITRTSQPMSLRSWSVSEEPLNAPLSNALSNPNLRESLKDSENSTSRRDLTPPRPASPRGPGVTPELQRPGVVREKAGTDAPPEIIYTINYRAVENAWPPEKVEPHMSPGKRWITHAPENIAELIANPNADWDQFSKWGIARTKVPVQIYNFPDMKTEIVVPADYVPILDKLRQIRLEPGASELPENKEFMETYGRRILPEEAAQHIQNLPQPDLVITLKLLNHASPDEPLYTYEHKKKLESENKPPDERRGTITGSAATSKGVIHFYAPASNDFLDVHKLLSHEWAHLLQKDEAFKAFSKAAETEEDGYFSREYARKNLHENWAVHLGERLLNPSGRNFADLMRQKAETRVLVMAKAVRNMLEERASNPTPMHQELLERINAAEEKATKKLAVRTSFDLRKDDLSILGKRVSFLQTAALEANSPEMTTKVLKPVRDRLMAAAPENAAANEALATYLAVRLRSKDSELMMKSFEESWDRVFINEDGRTNVFKILPERAQIKLLEHILDKPTSDTDRVLRQLSADLTGDAQTRVKATNDQIQEKLTNDAFALDAEGKSVPLLNQVWLENSPNPDARVLALKHSQYQMTQFFFGHMTKDLNPQQIKQMVVGDALSYVHSDYKAATIETTLGRLSRNEQVDLFEQLGKKHDSRYANIAYEISRMSDTTFSYSAGNIRDRMLAIATEREARPDYVLANPMRIKTADDLVTASKNLNDAQLMQWIKDGAFDRIPNYEQTEAFAGVSQTRDARTQMQIAHELNTKLGIGQILEPTLTTQLQSLISFA